MVKSVAKKSSASNPANVPTGNAPVKISLNEMVELFELQRSQLDSVRQQSQTVNAMVQELTITEHALTELKDYSDKSPTWIALGAGLFARAEFKDSSKLLSNYGSNIFGELSREEAIKRIADRKKELSDSLAQLQKQEFQLLQSLSTMERLLAETQRLQSQPKSNAGTPIVS